MMKKITGALILTMLLSGHLMAHSGKPDFHVIIDTDGALDDMRSISMLLAENDIRVLAITCSQGALLPDLVYEKVNSLLSVYHHEGIPLGISEKINAELPECPHFFQNTPWGNHVNDQDSDFGEESLQLLNKTLENYSEKITLIALGSLKTYADWIKTNPEISEKIERIIWYNNHQIEKGYNYLISPNSFEFIKQTGIQLDVVSNNSDKFFVNEQYFKSIEKANSIYATQIQLVHSSSEIARGIKQKQIQLRDDIVPLYLIANIIFETNTKDHVRYVSLNENLPEFFIFETITSLLKSATATNNRVFTKFPVDSSLYKPEYARILKSTIENYGLIEWKAICMTNEVHGHTGIYSIIGAKMGVRATEFFNVGVNNVIVTTFAGIKPPLSCFNDGIQISSGATIGQGLITVSDSISNIPSGIFEFNGRQVNISLKPEIALQMRKDINYGIQKYGLLTEAYWLYIETLAIQYWSNYDRHEIFLMIPVSGIID